MRRNRTSFCVLQSNVDNADSMLFWNVNTKMDNALAANSRKRLADRANSGSAWTSATALCMMAQSSGSTNDSERDVVASLDSFCITFLRRTFCCKTSVFVRKAKAGLSAFQSAPSTIMRELVNFKHIAVVNKHCATVNTMCLKLLLLIELTLIAWSILDIRRHLNNKYINAILTMNKEEATGPTNMNVSFVCGE